MVDVQPTNLQQLHDANTSLWTKITEECFQDLVESMPWRIKTLLNVKRGKTWYQQGAPNKVTGECLSPYILTLCRWL